MAEKESKICVRKKDDKLGDKARRYWLTPDEWARWKQTFPNWRSRFIVIKNAVEPVVKVAAAPYIPQSYKSLADEIKKQESKADKPAPKKTKSKTNA